MKSAIDDSF